MSGCASMTICGRLFPALKVGNQHFHAAIRERGRESRGWSSAKTRAPPTLSSSRLTLVTTANFSPSFSTASATRRGSSKSIGCGPPLGHGAKSAASRAQIAQQHEGRGVMVPALADVGAVRRLTNRVQIQLACQLTSGCDSSRRRARAPSATPAWERAGAGAISIWISSGAEAMGCVLF